MTFSKKSIHALLNAAGGAVVVAVIGFGSGTWITSSKANVQANEAVSKAVITGLTPDCLVKFSESSIPIIHKAALNKVNSLDRAAFVENN